MDCCVNCSSVLVISAPQIVPKKKPFASDARSLFLPKKTSLWLVRMRLDMLIGNVEFSYISNVNVK